jgi:hypothetical protein
MDGKGTNRDFTSTTMHKEAITMPLSARRAWARVLVRDTCVCVLCLCVFCAHVILWAISVNNQPTATPNAGHARGLASHKAAMDCRGPDMKSSAICAVASPTPKQSCWREIVFVFSSEAMERNSVEDMEWVKIGDSQEGDGFEDDEVPLENLSPAQLRELVLAGRKRVADLKLSMKVGGARREGFKEGLGCRPGRKGM